MPSVVYPPELTRHYDVRHTVGSGGFAKVKLGVHHLTGQKVAIKMMNKNTLGTDLPRVKREIAAMKDLCHQHVCQLYQVIETENHIFMVLEYAPGGELFDYIVAKDRLKDDEARAFFRQIISAVAYIHDRGYAHRDLKPENLLLDENQNIKLIDFGLVAKPEGGMMDQLETCCGSPAYAAPELISGLPYFGNEVDLWSMGVLLYALVCGFLPFDDDNTYKLYRLIQRGEYDVPEWLCEGTANILSELLQVNPEKRVKIQELLDHDWVMTGYASPVRWHSRIKKDKLDPSVMLVLAKHLDISVETTLRKVNEWKYDEITALYFLLVKMKSNGHQPQILQQYSKMGMEHNRSEFKENACPNVPARDQTDYILPPPKDAPQNPYQAKRNASSDENDETFDGVLRPRAASHPVSAPATPSNQRKNGVELMPPPLVPKTPRQRQDDSEEVFIPQSHSNYEFGNSGMTPIEQSKIWSQSLDHDLHKKSTATTPYKTPQRTRFCSVDAPSSASKWSARKQGLLSSFEDGLCRVLDAITPKRGTGSAGPRKVKALYNVSTTSTRSADEVLEELKQTIQRRNVLYKQKGYVLRCKTIDDRGKVILDFELEVCLIPKMELIGIRRRRMKGDTWAYKKVCGEVLAAAQL